LYKNIPKYIIHHAALKKHLMRHGYSDIPNLKDTWYYNINTHTIVLEDG